MDIVPLADTTPTYAKHLLRTNASGRNTRRATSLWAAHHGQSPTTKANIITGQPPPLPSTCRFTWGDYAALSYVWGKPKDGLREIMLNGRLVRVTANLEAALRVFAGVGEFAVGGAYKLWVDAVCINQADDA